MDLISSDIDDIIVFFVMTGRQKVNIERKLRYYLIVFNHRPRFCSKLLDAYQSLYFYDDRDRFLRKGALMRYYKEFLNGDSIIMKDTTPRTRNKFYPVFLRFGYSVVLSNIRVMKKANAKRGRFLYTDTIDMVGEISKCAIIKRKVDFWENWKETENKAKCGCKTFIQITPMSGLSKSDGITYRIADLTATKVCSVLGEKECLSQIYKNDKKL